MGKKPIIAIANSFDEFLPGHVHLNKVGRIVSEAIREAGGIPREFNTMAVDDGIAMGFRRLSIKDKRKERGEMDECLFKRLLLALHEDFREAASLCSKDTGFFPPGGEQIVNEL